MDQSNIQPLEFPNTLSRQGRYKDKRGDKIHPITQMLPIS